MRGIGYMTATVLVLSLAAGSVLQATNRIDASWEHRIATNVVSYTNTVDYLVMTNVISADTATIVLWHDRGLTLNADLVEGFDIYIKGKDYTNHYSVRDGKIMAWEEKW